MSFVRLRFGRGSFAFVVVLVVASLFAASGCKKSSEPEEETDGTPTVNSVCRNVSPIHPTPLCDGCTRDLCCPEVLACEQVAGCKALVHCQAPCPVGPTGTECRANCRTQHGDGEPEFSGINGCANRSCPIACTPVLTDAG